MNPTVILFDVDGTLLTSGGAGRRAMISAFAAVAGDGSACDGFSMAGMTDRAIIRLGLQAIGSPAADVTIDAILADYLRRLPASVSDVAQVVACHGVMQALAALRGLPHFAIGLGTGNVERGARIKLAAIDLNDHFSFGGFGCDAEDRAALIAVGAARGALKLGRRVEQCRVVIVGDTPKDVAAAHANGAQCVAVATGQHAVADLVAAGASKAYLHLAEAGAMDALIFGW